MEIVHLVSSVSVLICSGFDTFHGQREMEIVCRTFAILNLPYYLIFGITMLNPTLKGMSQRWLNHGRHCFWCNSDLLAWFYPNGVGITNLP